MNRQKKVILCPRLAVHFPASSSVKVGFGFASSAKEVAGAILDGIAAATDEVKTISGSIGATIVDPAGAPHEDARTPADKTR